MTHINFLISNNCQHGLYKTKISLIRILISPRLTYSRAEQWLTDEVCHVTDHWAWTQWTVPSVDRFLIKSMTGRSDMWTFVVVVDSSFVLECLWGKPKINMVNQEFQIEDRLSLPLWRRENPHNTAIFTQLSYLPSIQILLLSHCTKIGV